MKLLKIREFPSRLAICAVIAASAQAQVGTPTVSNVRATQRIGTKIVDITYDLIHSGNLPCYVTVEGSQDGGSTYAPLASVSGALGPGILSGANKSIEWRAAIDWTPALFNNVKVRIKADDAQDMALITAGPFEIGYDKYPQVTVNVSSFYISRTEVTWREWKFVRDWAATRGYSDLVDVGESFGEDGRPVGGINWYQAVKWLNAKSEMEGLSPAYYTSAEKLQVYRTGSLDITNADVNWIGGGYRLPTEAEWEKAARGGLTNQIYATGSAISKTTASIGQDIWNSPPLLVAIHQPNPFGLFDMSGNSWEWCWDRFGSSLPSGLDPKGPVTGSQRLAKGGSVNHQTYMSMYSDPDSWSRENLKVSYRYALDPGVLPGAYGTTYSKDKGFRVVRGAIP